MFKNRSKALFVCAVLATIYVIYLISYLGSDIGDLNSAEEVWCYCYSISYTTYGCNWDRSNFFLDRIYWKKILGRLVGAILYFVGVILFILYAFYSIPSIILDFV